MVRGTHIFFQWVVVQLKVEELAKVVVNRHLNPADCSGMTWAESAEGWKTEGLCLIKVEIRHDLEGRKKDCLLYTSPSSRDQRGSRMPSSA